MKKNEKPGQREDVLQHHPMLLIAHVACTKCYNNESFTKNGDCSLCGKLEYVFYGYDCVREFGDLLYKDLAHKAEKEKGKVYVFAHNLKGYDGQFVYRDLFSRPYANIEPTMC